MTELVFVESRPVSGRRHPVAGETTIGRQGCDVLLADPEVSRRHARVVSTGSGPAIEDLGSRNGTWVNDRRVQHLRLLRPGDVVRFGNTVWRVHEARGEPIEETVTAAPAVGT